MSPRLRRLQLDQERLQERFRDWPLIQVFDGAGIPPERYQVEFPVKGLELGSAGKIQTRDRHRIEVNLSLDYPRRMPQCKMLTPIFHPNFDQTHICIGDFWAAAEGLDDLLIRIGRMIAYQEYNTKSPLNGLAAKWAAEHPDLLPVDPRELAPPSLEREVALEPGLDITLLEESWDEPTTFPPQSSAAIEPRIPRVNPPGQAIAPSDSPPPAPRPITEFLNLAPELSLLRLRVRCDRCGTGFDLELPGLGTTVVCPACHTRHEAGKTYRCVALESAGLFWIQESKED